MSLVRFRPEAPFEYADLAHLVERHLAKVEVASSSLVIRSKKSSLKNLKELFSLFTFGKLYWQIILFINVFFANSTVSRVGFFNSTEQYNLSTLNA